MCFICSEQSCEILPLTWNVLLLQMNSNSDMIFLLRPGAHLTVQMLPDLHKHFGCHCSILQPAGALKDNLYLMFGSCSICTSFFFPGFFFRPALEFVFSPHACPCLYIPNAVTSIKLWHFSQITWVAASCLTAVRSKSMRVKDTICDLSPPNLYLHKIHSSE